MPRTQFTDLLDLSVAERIELVQDIWDSIASVPESLDLSDEQKHEIDRRLAKLDSDPESSISWEELKQQIGL